MKRKLTKWERQLKAEARKSSEVKVRTRGVTVKTSVRVPRAVWDRVRVEAIRRGVTAQSLIVEAIGKVLQEGAR